MCCQRIGHSRVKPTNRTGAYSAENCAVFSCLSKDRINASLLPNQQHVQGVAAADIDHILFEKERADVAYREPE
jgi:hypothetical protein